MANYPFVCVWHVCAALVAAVARMQAEAEREGARSCKEGVRRAKISLNDEGRRCAELDTIQPHTCCDFAARNGAALV